MGSQDKFATAGPPVADGEGAPSGAVLFSPCERPGDRRGTVTAVASSDTDRVWLDALAAPIGESSGERLQVLSDPGTASVPERSVVHLPHLDSPARRATAFRGSSVVVVSFGDTGASADAARSYAREAAATGCVVVSYDPLGVGDPAPLGPLAADPEELSGYALYLARNHEVAEREGERAMRGALEGEPQAGLLERRPRDVSVVLVTKRPDRVLDAVRGVDAQVGVAVELVVVGHGFAPDAAAVRASLAGGAVGEVRVLDAEADRPLGAVLNLGFAAADAPLLAKMDDDDLYAPHYLHEQTMAVGYSGADVVGKWSWHVYLASLGVTVLRRPGHEHRFGSGVSGATMLVTREAFAANPFPELPRGEDVGFVQGAAALGLRTYATSRFNFLAVRHGGDHGHAWRADDLKVATQNPEDRVRFLGPAIDQIFI